MKTQKKSNLSLLFLGKLMFALLGFMLGWLLVESIIADIAFFVKNEYLVPICSLSGGILFGVVGFFTSKSIFTILLNVYRLLEKSISKFPPRQIFMGILGLIFGLMVAVAIHLLLIQPYVGSTGVALILTISLGVVFSFFGALIGGNQLSNLSFFSNAVVKQPASQSTDAIILDSSSLIDGRVLDIVKCGFIRGKVIVPDFIFRELSLIADSDDMLKKNKGRRGLDILKELKNEQTIVVDIVETDFSGDEVNDKIIKLSELCNAPIVTVDFNLGKLAQIKSIQTLNVNDLSKAIKPIILPGERLLIKVVKEGKEKGQGVAYLEDGTMIVVENGGSAIGEEVDVMVTTAYQTSAGRMIFARIQ